MSGDVQPRKRKDKKKKKEDSTELPPQFHQAQAPPSPAAPPSSDDQNIHVHKDHDTGGGICAKIVFFLLFSALAVVIGLIITEHRGLTDLDTIDSESRFSQLFEGWIDNSPSHEDDHDEHIIASVEEHDGDDDEEEHQGDQSDEVEAHSEEHTEEDEEVEETEEDQTVEESEPQDDEDDEDEEVEASEAADDDEDEQEEGSEAADDDQDNNDDEEQDQDEVEDSSKAAANDEASTEQSVETAANDAADEPNDDEVKDGEAEPSENDNKKMVIKIGVGVALLVVAYVVLVKKWKSAKDTVPPKSKKEEPIPDLSRRNTIVVPPVLQEIEQDIEEIEDYSDEEGEVSEDDDRLKPKSAKLKYQELLTTYTRSLTPDSEPIYQKEPNNDDEDEEEEDDEGEYDDEPVDEEEEEDLLKRLEAKYGKIQAEEQLIDEEELEEEEEDEEEEEEEDEEDDDQFSSWKRVNVPSGNEPEDESDSDKQSDAERYEYESITNKDDWKIKEKIDDAQKHVDNNNVASAIRLFDAILQTNPSSPRSLYGKAQALDKLADQKRSNSILQQAIQMYSQILDLGGVPSELYKMIAERCINRLRFIGNYKWAIVIHNKLISRFPNDPHYQNQLAVTYLTTNRVDDARVVLKAILKSHKNDGLALVHYGFILKTVDNKLKESIDYLQRGLASGAQGVMDGRFFFHLGDALARVGRSQEAMKLYEQAVAHKLFLSKYQRSLYNVPRLKGQPWWTKEETQRHQKFLNDLEANWRVIRDEGLAALSKTGVYQSESENLKDKGDWKQLELFARGHKNEENCKKCPVTCKIIERVPDARGCRRGQTKFSVMHPGTHVWPHCGPTNCRLRIHLGLNVPEGTSIRVANETRSWENGKVLIFDDSFEHEVWHKGDVFRLVLIVDVWHPELTQEEKRSLSPI